MKETITFNTSDYHEVNNKIAKAFLDKYSSDTYPTVQLSVTIVIDHKKIPSDLNKLKEVYIFNEGIDDNEVARMLHQSGVTIDDLLFLEKDLRSFVPSKYLHPTRKFCLGTRLWGMDEYDDIIVEYPEMMQFLDDDGIIKESPRDPEGDLFYMITKRVNWDPVEPYLSNHKKWNHVRFDRQYLEYESK
jgi:hypothetical protein